MQTTKDTKQSTLKTLKTSGSEENYKIIDKLWDLGFVGLFPGNLSTLLVPVSTARVEINFQFDLDLTDSQFRNLLKDEEIFVWRDVDHWYSYKNPEKAQKRRFSGYLR